ncbi:hypothetical protein [Stenotrophomonas maltophilia]
MIPTASDMADAIKSNASKLIQLKVLAESSWEATNSLCSDLKRQRKSDRWNFSVSRNYPFQFSIVENEQKIQFRPTVSVKGIEIDPEDGSLFKSLDIALQVSCVDSRNHARWHFDKANAQGANFQAGPLFHLQFGGHGSGQGEDFWLKEPRWAHAPMDLILLLEAVTANFFTEKWTESVRGDPTWCSYVTQSERLCLTTYVEKISKSISISSDTVLSALWANPRLKR